MSALPLYRVRMTAAAALLALMATGCSWFKPKPEYEGVELAKTMQVPADLSKPRDAEALRIPAKSLIGANAANNEIVRTITVGGDVASVWAKVGTILPEIEGAEVLNSVQSIGSYEVRYAGEVFLVSVQSNGDRVRILAIGVDGAASETPASGQLLAKLKAKL